MFDKRYNLFTGWLYRQRLKIYRFLSIFIYIFFIFHNIFRFFLTTPYNTTTDNQQQKFPRWSTAAGCFSSACSTPKAKSVTRNCSSPSAFSSIMTSQRDLGWEGWAGTERITTGLKKLVFVCFASSKLLVIAMS